MSRILGIRASSQDSTSFTVEPHVGDLQWASGHIFVPTGILEVNWRVNQSERALSISLVVPSDVSVTYMVPVEAAKLVMMDDHLVWPMTSEGLNTVVPVHIVVPEGAHQVLISWR